MGGEKEPRHLLRRPPKMENFQLRRCFLFSAYSSECLIIQNLSISSGFRPGILPAIKVHLERRTAAIVGLVSAGLE